MNDPVLYFVLHHYLLLFFGIAAAGVVGRGFAWIFDEKVWIGIPTLAAGVLLWADFIFRLFSL